MQGIYGGKGGYVWATASPLMDRRGDMIGAIESVRDITERKEMESTLRESEKELEAKSRELEEINIALKVLLKHREEDQKEFETSVLSNMKELVFPYIEKLKKSALEEMQRTYVSILEAHLEEIGAPFLRKLSSKFAGLSPTERQIASLIKEGKRNKEISEIMGVSVNTILTHRYRLRTKLGLKNKNINLVSYLNSINS
jgi:DNA-binding CsgD family transcriptional regulator